jgi:hypothetical protein
MLNFEFKILLQSISMFEETNKKFKYNLSNEDVFLIAATCIYIANKANVDFSLGIFIKRILDNYLTIQDIQTAEQLIIESITDTENCFILLTETISEVIDKEDSKEEIYQMYIDDIINQACSTSVNDALRLFHCTIKNKESKALKKLNGIVRLLQKESIFLKQ